MADVSIVSIIVLLALLLIATYTDIARHKIYNWNTYSGIAAGFAIRLYETGWPGLQEGLAGFAVCGFVMLVCFVWFDMGGGDVKLIAMLGAFLGVGLGIEAMLWTFVLGSIMGMTILIWQIGILRIISKIFEHFMLVLRARSFVPLSQEERKPLGRWLFLAPNAFVAVCIVARDHLL